MQNTATEQPSTEGDSTKKKGFSCCICMDMPTGPVLTPCGHLFCWNCLADWLEMDHDDCPSCRGKITKENVTPIYGAGEEETDPRKQERHRERPKAHYEESEHSRNGRTGFGSFGSGFGMPGMMNFNFGGSHFMFGGGSYLYLILQVVSYIMGLVRRFMNNGRSGQEPSPVSGSTTGSASSSEPHVNGPPEHRETDATLSFVVISCL